MANDEEMKMISVEYERIGFGLCVLKKEGEAAHPDGYGIGMGNGYKFPSDEQYLKQLRAYAEWHGIDETKREMCERPYLLDLL